MKTSDLTTGERVLILRRRKQESQQAASERHGVSLYRFRQWETDEEQAPKVALGRLERCESCFVRRKRSGMPLHELASQMGVSRWWLIQMEHGKQSADALVAFWDGRKPGALSLVR